MNVLISGCSFTQWPDGPGGPNTCWPRYLDPQLNALNLAEAGAGNQYISHSIVTELIANRKSYNHVLVMWSGVTRLDYLTDITDPAWNELFDSYGFYRRLPGSKLGYIFSGGQMGTWFKNPVAHKMFNEMYKVSSELSLATINLMEIVRLQHYLENIRMPYTFMSYVNYWGNQERVSPNGDFGLERHPDLYPLITEINFANWLFTDNNKNGLYETAKSMNSFMSDGFHPGAEAHQAWADLVTKRLI